MYSAITSKSEDKYVVSLSDWGRPNEDGCPDRSDIIKDMKKDTSTDPCQGANYKSPRGYTYTVTDWFPCNKAAKGDIVKRNVNRQQEHANLLLISGQRWKLDGDMLKNEAGLWKSVDSWIFKPKDDDVIYIENISKTRVFGATSDGKVIQEFLVEGKANQLWKKGKPDAEGYFTLQNSGEPKVLTAISESSLEIKGIR